MKKPIEFIICDNLNVSWDAVTSKKRDEILVTARLIYFHIAITEIGIKQIAETLNIDRTELYHYKKVFADKMISSSFAEKYYQIEREYYTWDFNN